MWLSIHVVLQLAACDVLTLDANTLMCAVQRFGLPTSRKSTWKKKKVLPYVTPRRRHHMICKDVHNARFHIRTSLSQCSPFCPE